METPRDIAQFPAELFLEPGVSPIAIDSIRPSSRRILTNHRVLYYVFASGSLGLTAFNAMAQFPRRSTYECIAVSNKWGPSWINTQRSTSMPFYAKYKAMLAQEPRLNLRHSDLRCWIIQRLQIGSRLLF